MTSWRYKKYLYIYFVGQKDDGWELTADDEWGGCDIHLLVCLQGKDLHVANISASLKGVFTMPTTRRSFIAAMYGAYGTPVSEDCLV